MGNPGEFLLSAGNENDCVHAVELLERVELNGSNVSNLWPIEWPLYKERHLIECFFQKIKWFRRIATKYDKLGSSFLAFVYLAAIVILLI